MNNNISYSLTLLMCLLQSITTLADTDSTHARQITCSNDVIEHSNHIQLVEENWFTAERRTGKEYIDRIQQIESDDGVFSYALVPELIGLGLASQEQSKNGESAEAFERAMYIIRVNEGLYSIKQLPVLDLMIESNSAVEQWEKVAGSYDMMRWLYNRNYAKNDPRQLKALKRLRRWYMESYNKNTNLSLEELFSNAESLYEQAIRIMWECTDGNERQVLCFWHKACCANAIPEQGVCPLDRR